MGPVDTGDPHKDQDSLLEVSLVRTFLIADVCGYTNFTYERGDVAAARLASRFAEVVGEVVIAHDGQLTELRGDEALVVFTSARQALRAAVDLQIRFAQEMQLDASLPLNVGIGLDAGEAIPVKGGYRGGALNLAARLCSLAGPGDVFASDAIVHLARKMEGLEFADRGAVELKGLAKPVRVIQIAPEGTLPDDLEPLQQIIVMHPSSLPDEPTPFIGRGEEIDAVSALLQRPAVRLVTLTGTGGSGKTRLALQVGASLLYGFEDGVFFVSLASIGDPELVASAIAGALNVKEAGGQPLTEVLKDYLHEKRLLLILDNFEHLLGACNFVADLLEVCRKLKVLITSREVLHLSREYTFDVPPLPVPNPKHLPDLASLSQYGAVALFIERARAAKAGFAITNENAQAIAEICYRLDGLPLAIELAAARIRLFPPQALLGRLSSRLKLLTGGARDAPTRQQTLRGAIDWSYSLLDEGEQTLFARLAVFAGGCTLETALGVCDPEGTLDRDPLVGLASLVEKSLLRQDSSRVPALAGDPRFTMLETIREYAQERLEASGEADRLRRAHAAHFVDMAEAAEPELKGADQAIWLELLETEHDNLRAALDWLIQQKEAEQAVQLAGFLWRFWWIRGHLTEGRRWLDVVQAAGSAATPSTRAKVVFGAGNIAWSQGDYDRATALHGLSLALWRETGDRHGVAISLNSLGAVAHQQGNYREAELLYEESLAIERELGDRRGLALLLGNLGLAVFQQHDYTRAAGLCEESLTLWREVGDRHGIARVLNNLVSVALEQRDYARATVLQEESLMLSHQLRDSENIAVCLEGLAKLAAVRGEPRRAAQLWGAAEAQRDALGTPLSPDERKSHEPYLATARSQLDERTFERAWGHGRAMTLDQTMAFALGKTVTA
jgi:predicted ATPase/class 3 adenylate cyclase